jgi:hypothetical protein
MFYVIAYVLMSLGSFGMIMLLSRAGFEAENIDDFKGLNRAARGWPRDADPDVLDGRHAADRRLLRQAVGAAGGGRRRLLFGIWLAVVAVMFSLIGAFYYLRVVKVMYFDARGVRHGHSGIHPARRTRRAVRPAQATGIADSGGQGKLMIANGDVTVDGQPESRKTAKIRAGQTCAAWGRRFGWWRPKPKESRKRSGRNRIPLPAARRGSVP